MPGSDSIQIELAWPCLLQPASLFNWTQLKICFEMMTWLLKADLVLPVRSLFQIAVNSLYHSLNAFVKASPMHRSYWEIRLYILIIHYRWRPHLNLILLTKYLWFQMESHSYVIVTIVSTHILKFSHMDIPILYCSHELCIGREGS